MTYSRQGHENEENSTIKNTVVQYLSHRERNRSAEHKNEGVERSAQNHNMHQVNPDLHNINISNQS